MKFLLSLLLAPLLCLTLAQAAPLKVASLHPLLSEMAGTVGGERVRVVNLFPENGSLHAFEPTSAELSAAAGARLMLACGKGVEPYLAGLQESLPSRTRLLELGATVPDVRLPDSERTDPHWWNNPANMKRASRSLLSALVELDPAGEKLYRANQRAYAARMDKLSRQAQLILSSIPMEKRVLVTGHAAMCHFCEAFLFTPLPIHGIAMESEGDTASLARLLTELRQRQVGCIFTEVSASPRALEAIAAQVGARTLPLVMDGISSNFSSYDKLFSYNVAMILSGLTGAKSATAPLPSAPHHHEHGEHACPACGGH